MGYPFTHDGQDFIPAVNPTFHPSQSSDFLVRACNLALHPQTKQPQTEMKFEIFRPNGTMETIHQVGLLKKPGQPEPNCFELTFQINWDEVPEGPGLFRMLLTDVLAGKTVRASSPYVLEP